MTRIADDFEAISQRLRELQQQLRKDSPTQRRIGVDDLDPSWPDPKLTRPIQCGVCMDVGWLLVSKLPGLPPAKRIYPSLHGPVVVCHACRNPRKMSPSSILLGG
jgi:hypothetical protein